MKQYELRVNEITLFSHTNFNACIGQAKYYYRQVGLRGTFYIWDNVNRIIYSINLYTLKEEK